MDHSGTGSYSTSQEDLTRRLRKIEGQVKGIERMVEENQYCMDVLVQIAAVRAALNKVGTIIFEHHTRGCVADAIRCGTPEEQEAKITELVNVLNKYIK